MASIDEGAELTIEDEVALLQIDEDAILEASLNEYQRYLDQLDAARSHLDELLASTTATLDQLAGISKAFRSIDQQTAAFQQQSVTILNEQRQNEKLAADLAENLKYYEPLERITRRMNAPGAGNFVRTQDFRDMLLTLDECIDYMQTHPEQKEAELYRSRYKQLLTRALTLVRNTFIAGARDVTDDVSKRINDKQTNVSETLLSSMLYAKFRVDAPLMKDLGLELQKRAVPPADAEPGTEGEYQSLMNELHQAFASCRLKLVLPITQQKLSEIAASPTSSDLVTLAKSSITYIRGVCLDEFELWEEWFHGQRGVYDFLEALCDPLFDQLRPRIIHETKLSKLCSLVSLIQTRYIKAEDEDEVPDPTQLDFASLVQPALEDAQTRLVFRTLALLRDEIEYYKPTPEDLDYPHRVSEPPTPKSAAPLFGRKTSNIATTLPEDDSGDEANGSSIWSRNRLLDLSYPTLPRAIRLLSRIYRLVNSSVFDDLAHQIVHSTTLSLVAASKQIESKSSQIDAQLFLLRHLLLLKSQIIAFDIEYVSPDVQFDFSGVTSTFYEIRDRGGLFNPRSWMRLFSSGGLLPRVVENMLDAKVELDGQLRTVINDFTAAFTATMTMDLKPGMAQKPEDATAATRTKIQQEVPILRAKLEQYLDDLRTRETLVAAVEDQVVQAYETFFEEYVGKASKGKANGIGAGKGKTKISRNGKGAADDVWDSDTFAEWSEGMFNVVLPRGEDEDESPDTRSISRSRSS